MSFDFSHYTYIVTCGHELRSIKYSLSQTKNRRFLFIRITIFKGLNLSL